MVFLFLFYLCLFSPHTRKGYLQPCERQGGKQETSKFSINHAPASPHHDGVCVLYVQEIRDRRKEMKKKEQRVEVVALSTAVVMPPRKAVHI